MNWQQLAMTNYNRYISAKGFKPVATGFKPRSLNKHLKPFQKDSVLWALSIGKSALFFNTGLGKTISQLAWAKAVADHTNQPVLIIAPLCVSSQTVREGEKFGIKCEYIRNHNEVQKVGIYVTNYEMVDNLMGVNWTGVVLDESSILKGQTSKYRKMLTETCADIPYRLSCTATPSPNDFMELGTQSEWLGNMSQSEMLAMFFIHDGGETQKWRLKGHAKSKFWEWMSTWSILINQPGDLGYDEEGYDLPPLNYHHHVVETNPTNSLFVDIAIGLNEQRKAKRETMIERVQMAADTVNESGEQWIVWCELNDESKMLSSAISASTEVKGSDKQLHKENSILGFIDGDIEKIVTKPSIYGFGMNLQNCHNMMFVGLSNSFEKYYQAIRRCWRFGQENSVNVHIVSADSEGAIVDNIKRKQLQHDEMSVKMISHMAQFTLSQLDGHRESTDYYDPQEKVQLPSFL